jgi:hypothetical protein
MAMQNVPGHDRRPLFLRPFRNWFVSMDERAEMHPSGTKEQTMTTHLIEWKRVTGRGRTCQRCSDTGQTLRELVHELNAGCGGKGRRFRLKTTRLPASRLAESNSILIDGRPLEQIVPGVSVTQTDCASCGDLTGTDAECRALVAGDRIHEAVPAELIRKAVCQVAACCGDDCACDCGCGGDE